MKDQTAIMKGQLESMNSGSAQTQQMIAAMQKQADATTTQADTALAVAEQNKELVTHAGEQAKASLAQAEAAKQSVGAAQASARAAQLGAQVASESFYIGDRPYVFAGNMVIEKFDVGVKPRIGVVFTNSGKTPAIDFRFAGKASIGREPSPAKDSPSGVCCFEPTLKQLPTGSLTTLPAGEKVAAVIELEGELDKATIDDIKDGKRFLFVYGIASYKDGLGKPHDLKFCSLYLHSMEMFAPCTEFNSTN
jgi:hypothetical protein